MKMTVLLLILTLTFGGLHAQELPYKSILKAPENYSAASVMARMVDGLGYRFYWASEGLKAEDLSFGPEGEGRDIRQTTKHIYDLCLLVLQSVDKGAEFEKPGEDFEQLRAETLKVLYAASIKLRELSDKDVETLSFRGMPLWYMINGPIADAIYHTGQIVLLRRMAGNPMNPNVNVLTGVNR